jgi:phosphoglycolate phosphatase
VTLKYPAVIFDLDGTLVDSYVALLEAVNAALSSHGKEHLGVEELRRYVGEGVEVLMERSFRGEVPHGATRQFLDVYDEICCAKSHLLDQVESTLVKLDAHGVAMSVCTNKPTSYSLKIVEALGIARYFRSVVGPDLAGARKPDPRHVLHALSALGHDPSAALFVGDMPIDVEAARSAGMRVATIATGSADFDELAAAAPDYMLERFSDLVDIVQNGGVDG